ncbi:hypothetical protein EIN_021130 [Entamoeba invadens IP1]|uniref:hypothetical protein n=1 Tax=Entamoeba invadens IP1 TaxID=370355 RepID=UPI0002C3D058|nr:hypothetical protein EIN_021130 [Entamoeba invadens IP1]ELP90604.1 hypothetical protein EIN_021130 [Entamoeba invadens IP1]|eukprot:XP_004257375.1 hypothetical protein EIN_021130 [Entamoeba invadens IP1]
MVRELCQKLLTLKEETDIIETYDSIIGECQDKEKGTESKQSCLEENLLQSIIRDIQSTSSDVVRSAGAALRCLLTNFEPAQSSAVKSGLPTIVASQLQKYSDIPEISGVLSGSIWGMADSQHKNLLVNPQIANALSSALNTENEFALTSAVGALLTLAEDDDFVKLLGKTQIFKQIAGLTPVAVKDEALARIIGGFLCNAAGESTTQKLYQAANGIDSILQILEAHQSNVQIISRILSGIRSLSSDDTGVLEDLIKVSKRFITIAETHPSEEVVVPLLGILFNFSQTDSMEEEVHNTCTVVVQKFCAVSKDASKIALGYFMNLSTCETVAKEMAKSDVITMEVKKAMDKYESVEKIITRGCGYLQNISDFEEGRDGIMKSGITKNIVDEFKKHQDEEEVVKSCLSAILNMSQEDELALELMKLGAAKEIDEVLKKKKDEEIVKLALVCVINITSSDGIDQYLEKDWAKHTVECLEKYTDKLIKEKAVTAICGIAMAGNAENNLKNELIKEGAVEALAKAFHVSQVTETKALNALFALSSETEAAKKIIEARVLSSAAQTVKLSAACSENFCGLVANCAKSQDVHPDLITYVDDIIAVISAKKTEKAVMFGLNALINLCSNKETREALRKYGVVAIAAKSISSFKAVKQIVVSGWSALGNMSIDEVIKTTVDAAGVFELCVDISKLYKEDETVLEKIVNFIAAACNKSQDNKKTVKEKLPALLDTLEASVKNQKTKEIVQKIKTAVGL